MESNQEDDNHELLFSVIDSGIGIKEEDQDKLFKFFGKLDNDNLNPSGIGLGLTICNKILNQFGSELKLNSMADQGSIFYFHMKLKPVSEESSGIYNVNGGRSPDFISVETF